MLGVISYWRLHPLVTVLVVTVASHFVHESVRKTKGDYAWDIERHKGKQVVRQDCPSLSRLLSPSRSVQNAEHEALT